MIGDANEGRTVGRSGRCLKGESGYIDPAFLTPYIAAMALRDILILPDKRLRLISDPVKAIDKTLRTLVEDMFETMYAAPGIGLAAIQIGVPQRVVTIDLAKKDEPPQPQVFINPEVTWASDEKSTYEEGCLSIPEYYEEVERPSAVKVKYLDLDGKPHEIEADGLLATCLQHEIDHTQRRAVHRPYLQAQARPGDEEVQEGGEDGGAKPIKPLSEDKEPSHHGLAADPRSTDGKRKQSIACRLRLIFMGTPDFAVPTLLELVARRARDRGGLYAARRKPGGPRHGAAADAGRARGARASACRCARRRRCKSERGAGRLPRA